MIPPDQTQQPASDQNSHKGGIQSSLISFSARIKNALIWAAITSLRRLSIYAADLLHRRARNLGPKGLVETQAVLAQNSQSLALQLPKNTVPDLNKHTTIEARASSIPTVQTAEAPVEIPMGVSLIAPVHDPVEPAPPTIPTVQAAETSEVVLSGQPDDFFGIVPTGLSADILLASLQVILIETATLPALVMKEKIPPTPPEVEITEDGKTNLSTLWAKWCDVLSRPQQRILFSYYGIDGEAPLTLEEIGDELGLTRARVHQIKLAGFNKLHSKIKWSLQEPLYNLLASAVEKADKLLTADEWQQALDEGTIWDGDEARPSLLSLLCELFGEFAYNNHYDVICSEAINESLKEYHTFLKVILSPHKQGLSQDALIEEIRLRLPKSMPSAMREEAFLVKAVSLFDRVEQTAEGRYHYRRAKKTPLFPTSQSIWLGKSGTQLHKWEQTLRQQIEKVTWIGQIALSEEEFTQLCQIIQVEAQAPNYFTKKMDGQPRLVPAAVFMTTMVFAARYLPQDGDEFWVPYLRSVWNVEYTQTFMTRCRKRFNLAVAELEQALKLEFPRRLIGDVVAPIYRHALLPRYVQDDFAEWMRDNWRDILRHADSPTLLIETLQQDSGLDRLPRRLQAFILGNDTKGTAAHLIADMAAAISLYVNHGESFENIRQQLADTPIKQELWNEIAKGIMQELVRARANERPRDHIIAPDRKSIDDPDSEIGQPSEREIDKEVAKIFPKPSDPKIAQESDEESTQIPSVPLSPLHLSPPRVEWVWVVDEGELTLRVQNIILPPDGQLEGEAERLVWVESDESDPTHADIEIEVRPWVMKTGERVIQDVLFEGVDGRRSGQIVLLTDLDEVAARLPVPSLPNRPIQFFRLTQQGAYGLPVDHLQVGDGVWLVCAKKPLTFRDEDNKVIEPDGTFSVPYPLHDQYKWAAQLSLTLPVTIEQGNKKIWELVSHENQAHLVQPSLHGAALIGGLSAHLQPIFSSTQISVTIADEGGRLVKQATLWLIGQDGWRQICPLTEMIVSGEAVLDQDSLHLDLNRILPTHPNVYALDLRASLQPLFAAPLYFAVLPGVRVIYPAMAPLYTPATPFQITLVGIDAAAIVPDGSMSIEIAEGDALHADALQITWRDLRNDPRLLLRWGNVEIPLLWSVPRLMAWLDPKPTKAFLTMDELRHTTLHAVGKQLKAEKFTLSVTDQGRRDFPLRRGRSSIPIAQSQLFDMIRSAQSTRLQVNIEADNVTWHLFDVRQRPVLSGITVEVDEPARMIHFRTGLLKDWVGRAHFFAESHSNPFAPPVALGNVERLTAVHQFPFASLADDTYRLRLELDSAPLPLDEQATVFTIGSDVEEEPQDPELERLIRSGELIPESYTNDFILWWAVIAETGKTEITLNTRYQLASIHANDLKFFDYPHLKKLWPALADLRAVRDKRTWFKEHGLLPKWVLQPNQARYPSAASYLPEPVQPEMGAIVTSKRWQQLAALTKVLGWYGAKSEGTSPWAGAPRLLNHWKDSQTSELGRGSFALAMVLRTAAYYPHRYSRLLKEAALSETDIQELLALINLYSADHLRWGLTWAELLFVHSSRYSVR